MSLVSGSSMIQTGVLTKADEPNLCGLGERSRRESTLDSNHPTYQQGFAASHHLLQTIMQYSLTRTVYPRSAPKCVAKNHFFFTQQNKNKTVNYEL
jgi:hypothetical protein